MAVRNDTPCFKTPPPIHRPGLYSRSAMPAC